MKLVRTLIPLVLVAGLTGCGLGSSGLAGGSQLSGVDTTAIDSAGAGMDMSKMDPTIDNVDHAASVIRYGDMQLASGDVRKTSTEIADLVKAAGGHVETSMVSDESANSSASASLTVRIPETKFDESIAAIGKLAKQTSLTLSSSDVTLQKVDLEAKVNALTTSRDRLLELMKKATNTADLIAAEQALAQRQSELDSYKSQLEYLQTQVAESTLNIYIVSDSSSVTQGLRSFKEIFLEGIRSFLHAFQSVILFLFAAIPWVIVLGTAWILLRRLFAVISRWRRKPPVD
jgi:hypothetical protein